MKISKIHWVLVMAFFSLTALSQKSDRPKPKERPTTEEIFKHMDANEDALLSKDEVKGPLKYDFDKIDINEDGYLSKEEIEKAPKPNRRKSKKDN